MINKVIKEYKIERKIGEGGMGNVYLATHLQNNTQAAIKALHPYLLQNEEIRKRFRNEAMMLAQLNHPSIVALYDYIEQDEGSFLIMEYAQGNTLDEYIEKINGLIPEKRAIKILSKILETVDYAHRNKIIHRDLKPSNILIYDDDKIKILDFGIAKILDESSNQFTKTGTKVGTVFYMSPEQVKGKKLDLRTDIYSLGISLFQMITGEKPYNKNEADYEIFTKIVNEKLPDARKFYPAASSHIVQVIEKATQKEPSKRFANCQEFLDALNNPNWAFEEKTIVYKEENTKVEKKEFKFQKKKIFIASFLILFLVSLFFFLKKSKKEVYILSYKAKIFAKPSNVKTALDFDLWFGDTLYLLDEKVENKNSLSWKKLQTKNDLEGYLPSFFLGSKKEIKQLSLLFGEYNLLSDFPLIFKKAVLKYFLKNKLISKENKLDFWKLKIEKNNKKNFIFDDFDKNKTLDFVCVLENEKLNKNKIILFASVSDTLTKPIAEFDFHGNISIRKTKNFEKLFVGNYENKRAKVVDKKYNLENAKRYKYYRFRSSSKEYYFYYKNIKIKRKEKNIGKNIFIRNNKNENFIITKKNKKFILFKQ